MRRWLGTATNGAILAGVLALGWQSANAMLGRRGAGGAADRPWVSLAPGQHPPEVMLTGAGGRRTLDQVGGGRCRLLIVYSATCGASAIALQQWARQQRTSGPLTQEGWTVAWIADEDSAAAAAALPTGFATPVYFAEHAGKPSDALGIRAFPVHIVLDRESRVVAADIGASIPERGALRPDCTIADRSTETSTTRSQ